MTQWILILVASSANIVLNMFLRQLGRSLDLTSYRGAAVSIIASPWLWLSILSGFVLVFSFIAAIRSNPLSITYAAVSAIAMAGLTLLGLILQTEALTAAKVVGIALMLVGVLVSASS